VLFVFLFSTLENTIKKFMQVLKKPTKIESVRLNRLRLFGHVQRMEENIIPKRVLYMNLGTTRLRGRPSRWQGEVREDGRIVGGEEWQEKVHNREEWKKLLRMARNHCILHMPMEQNRKNNILTVGLIIHHTRIHVTFSCNFIHMVPQKL